MAAAALVALPGAAHAAAPQASSGILHRTVSDAFPGGTETTLVTTASGATITIPDGMAGSIRPGSRVTVTRDAGGAVTGVSGGMSAAAAQPVAGTHHLTIVPVRWQPADLPPAERLAALAATADEYYAEATGGRIRFVLDRVAGPQQIAAPSGCDAEAIQTAVRAVAGDTVRDRFHHVVAYFPAQSACGWSGLGNLGTGRYGDSFVWLNGTMSPLVLGHELGHNLGLRHSNGFHCTADSGAPVPLSDHCAVEGYADRWDIMGNLATGQLSASHLDTLGLLGAAGTSAFTGAGQVVLAPLSGGSGLRQATWTSGTRTYLMEYRDGGGLDRGLRTGTGLAVRLVDSTLPGGFERDQQMISFHPADRIPVLRPGEGWSGGFSLRVGTPTAAGLPVTFSQAADVSPPTAFRLLSPSSSTSTDVTVSWTAVGDDSGVASVSVLVDGVVRTVVAGSATSAVVAVPDGRHSLSALATDLYGNTTRTPAVPVTVDGTAPAGNPPPGARLRAGGIVSAGSLPVSVSWGLTDVSGVARQRIAQRAGTGGRLAYAMLGPAVRQSSASLKPGVASRWQLDVSDTIGHSGTVAGPWTTGRIVTPTQRTGTWRTRKGSALLGGSEVATGTRGGTMTFTATGRSFGWVGTRDRTGSDVDVYADGKRMGSVSQFASQAQNRTLMYVVTWPVAGTHTVKLVNRGTGGRPRMSVDAFAVLS